MHFHLKGNALNWDSKMPIKDYHVVDSKAIEAKQIGPNPPKLPIAQVLDQWSIMALSSLISMPDIGCVDGLTHGLWEQLIFPKYPGIGPGLVPFQGSPQGPWPGTPPLG